MFNIYYGRRIAQQQIAISKLLKLFTLIGVILAAELISPISTVFAAVNINYPLVQYSNETLSVVGDQVLYSNGHPYIPEGISVYGGLEDTDYMENIPNVNAQIIAGAKYWHANTIRLQIAESDLFTNLKPGQTYNKGFLQEIIKQVNLALSLNMFVVLNDQTEFTSHIPGPTLVTVKFWTVMSQTFKNQLNVIFDLFNEPRIGSALSLNGQSVSSSRLVPLGISSHTRRTGSSRSISANTWNLWKNGGKFNGVTYIGIQALVNQIRGYGVNNLIWVEGPNEARELPAGKYLIKGSNIVYSFHHPNLNNPSSWNKIAALSNSVPVVDGEWAQYQSPWAECYARAYKNVPIYLNYLQKHNIGIIAWSLQAGSLLQDSNHTMPSNLNTPNSPKNASDLKSPSKLLPDYGCGYEFGQGVGQLLQTYFAQNSSRYSSFN